MGDDLWPVLQALMVIYHLQFKQWRVTYHLHVSDSQVTSQGRVAIHHTSVLPALITSQVGSSRAQVGCPHNFDLSGAERRTCTITTWVNTLQICRLSAVKVTSLPTSDQSLKLLLKAQGDFLVTKKKKKYLLCMTRCTSAESIQMEVTHICY